MRTAKLWIAAALSLVGSGALAAEGLSVTSSDWINGKTALFLSGDIEHGDAALMRKALRQSEGRPIIAVLDSRGGNLSEALKIGRMLTDAGATTFVPSWGTCASACFYTYAGGKTRFVGEGAQIGVHQFSYADTVIENANVTAGDAQSLYSEINLYLLSSGVSPVVGTLAGTVPPDDMLFFDYPDLKMLGIVTYYSNDGGAWASGKAAELSKAEPVSRYTKDPGEIDWCGVPVFAADGTFKRAEAACEK